MVWMIMGTPARCAARASKNARFAAVVWTMSSRLGAKNTHQPRQARRSFQDERADQIRRVERIGDWFKGPGQRTFGPALARKLKLTSNRFLLQAETEAIVFSWAPPTINR